MVVTTKDDIATNVTWRGPLKDLEPLMRLYFKDLGPIAWRCNVHGDFHIAVFRNLSEIPRGWTVELDDPVSTIAGIVVDNLTARELRRFSAQSLNLDNKYIAYMTI